MLIVWGVLASTLRIILNSTEGNSEQTTYIEHLTY